MHPPSNLRHGSATGRAVRAAWAGIRDGLGAAPRAVRRRFVGWFVGGTLAVAALSGASALWLSARAVEGRLGLDEALEPGMRGLLTIHQSVWIAAVNSSAVLVPVVVLVALWAGRTRRWARAVGFVALYVACKVVTTTGWTVWERARPGDVADGILVPEGLASYPSGHTLQGVALWGLLAWWWTRASGRWIEKAVVWAFFAVSMAAVGVARVVISAHHPTDVIAGAALGLGLLVVAVRAVEAAEPDRRA